MPKCAYFKIKGIVQGVNLRYDIFQFAQSNKLKGWVKNEIDGTVTCCLQNPAKEVEQFRQWLKYSHSSYIQEINIKWQEDKQHYKDFMILR
ncbi:acylphosphatase [Patescibacteria group bacterium]|nr:acylphosphatase [Patescibacteria group bacterium]